MTEDYYVVLQSVLSFGGSTDYSFYQNGMCYEKGDLSDFELYALQLLNDWDEDPDYDKSKETAYSDGITLAENGNYEAAIQKLGALEGYKASDNVVGTCKNYQLSQEYKDAIDLFAEKHYAQAAAALTELLKNQENGYLRAERALYLCDYYADEDVGSAEEADNEATTPAEELPTAGAWGELPRVCSFEYDLNSAIGSYYRSKGYSEDEYEYLLAKDYEVTDFAEYEDAGCDQAISGLYCDRAFHFLACVKNDKVYLCESIMAQDVLPNFTNATEEEQITWLQQLMIPVTAYCYDMDPCDLVEQIFQNGEETEENVWVLTFDGIEYTLVIANDQVDFTIDARAWLSDGELEMNNAASEEPLPTTETGGDVSKAPSYGNDQNKNQGNNGSSGSAPSGSTGNSGTDGSASSGSTGSSSESIQTTPTVPTEPPSSCEMWGHDWVPITETVHHDEAGHYETYQDAKKVQHYKCFYCGYNTEFNSLDEYYAHYDQKHEDKPDMRERYDVVDRWEYYDAQRWVVDTPAYDESVVTGYVCSVCGATK